MTELTFVKGAPGWRGFEVHGHSGYARAGSDIVCSAVSALTQTAAMALEELLHLDIDLRVKEKEGYLSCYLPCGMDADIRAQAELLLNAMALGLRDIEQSYSAYIHITERTEEDGR